MLGGLGALLVLAFVFGSFLALVPILMAIVSIMTTFLVVWGLTTITDVSPIVQFLIALIGLGVAIDYALLVVVRWREERAHGLAGEAAIERAMQTAGRAVVFSGTTVAIGLLALVALPLPFLRSVGYGGMLIPLISVVVALTLLPVVLAKLGPRLDWPHVRDDDKASRVVDGLGAAASSAGAGSPRSAPRSCSPRSCSRRPTCSSAPPTSTRSPRRATPSRACWRSSARASARARSSPNEVLVHGSTPAAARGAAARGACPACTAPSRPPRRSGAGPERRSSRSSRPRTPRRRPVARRSIACVRPRGASGPDVHVGGLAAQNADFIDAVYGNFPLMIALIALITFVLLARAFRSLLLPLKAVILNVISVAAAWGVLDARLAATATARS